MTTSQTPARRVVRMKPRRCSHQVYCTRRPRSLATICAIAFSNPSARSFEYGRLFGSAQTRSAGPEAVPRSRATPHTASVTAATVTANTSLETEDIQHAPGTGVLLDVLHRPDDA